MSSNNLDFSIRAIKEDIGEDFILSSQEENPESNNLELSKEVYELLKQSENLEKEVREDLNRNNSNDVLPNENNFNFNSCVDQYLSFKNELKNIKPILETNSEVKLGNESEQLNNILPSLCQACQTLNKHAEQMKNRSESLNKIELFCKNCNYSLNEQNQIHKMFEKFATIPKNDRFVKAE